MTTDARRTAAVGTVVALGALTMGFSAVLFVVLAVRTRAEAWPPFDVQSVWLNTALLVASSAAYGLFRGRQRYAIAAALGLAFVAGQAVWWAELVPSSDRIEVAVGIALSVFHAFHVGVGLAALVVLATRNDPPESSLWGWYWHFVLGAWLMLVGVLVL